MGDLSLTEGFRDVKHLQVQPARKPSYDSPSTLSGVYIILLSAKAGALKHDCQNILSDKTSLENSLTLCSSKVSPSRISYTVHVAGAGTRTKTLTHPSVCTTQIAFCSCRKDSAQFPPINASLLVPGGLPVTYRNTSPQAR